MCLMTVWINVLSFKNLYQVWVCVLTMALKKCTYDEFKCLKNRHQPKTGKVVFNLLWIYKDIVYLGNLDYIKTFWRKKFL